MDSNFRRSASRSAKNPATFTPNSSLSTLDKFAFPSSSTSVDKLPSIDFQLTKQAAREHFLATPLISGRRREPLDCFGITDQDVEPIENIFSRSSLRTPPEIREFILKERKEQKERLEKSVAFAKSQQEQQRSGVKDGALVGFGRGFKHDIHMGSVGRSNAQSTVVGSAVPPRPTAMSKRSISADLYDVSAKVTLVDDSTKFFFSEGDKERRKQVKDERTALLQSRKQKAIAERSAKIEKAQSVKSSQKFMLDGDMYDPEFENVRHKYVGLDAKQDLMRLYVSSQDSNFVYPNDDDLPEDLKSPHMMMLRDQMRRNLSPLPLIVRSENKQKGVYLPNKGLGDDRVLPIISVLDTLPAVYVIDLSDNRLTDKSLMPLALKLSHLPNLTSLNLSFNKIDESSETIMEYLRNRKCKLRVLVLNGADVDDDECANLMDAIGDNRSIDTLSLSNNLIGKKETLNTVYPDLITGGESIAQLLLVTTTLRSLDVSWNFIRLSSAEELGRSLSINISLRVLNLAHNAFGKRYAYSVSCFTLKPVFR
jgi:Leucine-rich repeat (LRR) protein